MSIPGIRKLYIGSTDVVRAYLGETLVYATTLLDKLFANDEPGFWLNASPETCFTDLAGTTPAGPGDSVAYWQDLSGNDNHATQPTVANRPILGRKPVGGRRNLLERTEELTDSSYWTDSGFTFADHMEAIGNGFFWFHPTTTNARLFANNVGDVSPENVTVTYSIYFIRTPENPSAFAILSGSSLTTNSARVRVNTGTLELSETGGDPFIDAGVEHISGDVYRLYLTHDGTGQLRFCVRYREHTEDNPVFIGFPQLEEGSTFTPYQRVTNRFDVTEAGVPDRHYLFFGGASDPRGMQTPVITPGTDKVQVFTGLRKHIDENNATVIEAGNTANDLGSFLLTVPTGSTNGFFRSRGTGAFRNSDDLPDEPAPASMVLAGIGDISGPLVDLRYNGVSAGSNNSSQGSGNYESRVMHIGTRLGASNFYDGEIYSLITRFGSNLSEETIAQVESYIADNVPEETLNT